ncbi:GSCFA family protein [Formosa agariphila KMM 3901]|uniref:GSCFA family protein n=1 Tax=Formosa agariphila (strain DSM 15362 / KCTC 12365 / LMG 23005 / KMM 3901 / M-2Alg 35-1) TaxID=1347342 RepID=T2KQ07_FORAG|nr:GSCFA domain-containing protein [Formosa agariphila]CDF80541.1 GSCFA family protein [Formosa agariphila KMM 3901]
MKFFTEIPIQQQTENQIDYQSKVLLLGSCFVENIGQKFDFFKFKNLQNPFGVLFQPKAIEHLITHAIKGKVYTEDDLFLQNELWHCYQAHSKLSGIDKTEVLNGLNVALQHTKHYLESATHIVITLGTAWVYRHLESNTIVANCHKVPQKAFKKELLSSVEILESLQHMLDEIAAVNPKANVIFTVSPIRHTKDGMVENTRSKSHLISAIHQLVEINKKHQLYYFPSYEIMMDELRDYRFYASDLIHPNQVAIDYIWDKFKASWLSSTTTSLMKEVQIIQNGLHHKPINASSVQHQKFLKDLHARITAVKREIEGVSFSL